MDLDVIKFLKFKNSNKTNLKTEVPTIITAILQG